MPLLRARLRGVAVEIDLAPRVALDPGTQRDVQRAVEDRGVEITYVQRATETMEFGRRYPNSRESLTILVEPQTLRIEEAFPRAVLSAIVQEVDEIAKAVLNILSPAVIPVIRAVVQKQVAAPSGDARVYLGEGVLSITGERRATLGRPIHTVGLRLFMPPYRIEGPEGAEAPRQEDTVHVRVESLVEDTADLLLECTREFRQPLEASGLGTLGDHIRMTDDFINQQVGAFLGISASEEGAGDA